MLAPYLRFRQVADMARLPLDAANPLFPFALANEAQMKQSLTKFGVGAIVTSGQTGIERGAFLLASARGIPHTGFAPIGFINEAGGIPEEIQSTMITEETADTPLPEEMRLSSDVVLAEARFSPYRRRETVGNSELLNARWSSATLVLTNAAANSENSSPLRTLGPLLSDSESCLIIDIDACDQQTLGDAIFWISSRRPEFLHITGPSENLGREGWPLLREQAFDLLSKLFPDSPHDQSLLP